MGMEKFVEEMTERAKEYGLNDAQAKIVVDDLVKDIKNPFPKKEVMKHLTDGGIHPSVALDIMICLRKGNEMTPEWKQLLNEKGISVERFITK